MAQPRLFVAEFYDHAYNVIKTIYYANPNSASMHSFNALQLNLYGARTMQVYHRETGLIFIEQIRHVHGKIETTYSYDPSDYKNPVRRNLRAMFPDDMLQVMAFVLKEEQKKHVSGGTNVA